MLNTILVTVGFFGTAMVLMAMGVILSDRRLKGSCGGKGGEDCVCEIEKRRACHAAKQLARNDPSRPDWLKAVEG